LRLQEQAHEPELVCPPQPVATPKLTTRHN
jgi:hypothetical protein